MVRAAMLLVSAVAGMEWEEYKQQFGKVYNSDDEAARKAIFEQNQQQWGQHESGAVLGPTQFSDLTLEEFQGLNIRGFTPAADSGLPKLGEHEYQGEDLAGVDWTTKGAVTPVKNQGQCGSCWAFSTTGGLEGSWQLASGTLTSMSEQQFVDCSKQNSGCNGGLMDTAFSFAEGTAVATESSYPYTARDGSCKSSFSTAIPRGGVTGYTDVSNSASALKSALNGHPISVAIQADQSVFQQYTGGVITSGCGSQLDHGVLATGYDGNTITVKNSWGSSWGVNGYVKMDASQCGITTSASYPKVNGAPVPPPAPTPPTPPPPPTPAPTPGSSHYGAPPCQPDETADELVDESGAHIGAICDAKCTSDSDCPTDTPGGTAQPGCILQDSDTGDQACGLECGILGGTCPDGATCSSQLVGVCYWPGTTANGKQLKVKKDVVV